MSKMRKIAAAAAIATGVATVAGPVVSQPVPTTVVLVHGAFADGSSWNGVIPLLQAAGLNVVAVQNPLTSLADDVAATKRAIDMQKGPIVLVGHSWAGTVITEAGDDDRVKALVYVAAFAPAAGQTTNDLGKDYPTPPGLANPIADAAGFLTLSPGAVAHHFAQDVAPEQANLIAVTQGPVFAPAFDEPVKVAAWQDKPTWYIVAEQDHMIDPDLERDLARKINAQVTSLPTSHVPMVSRPQDVARVIVTAAGSLE